MAKPRRRRRRKLFLYKGERLVLAALCRKYGVCQSTIKRRLKKGMTIDEAVAAKAPHTVIEYRGETLSIREWSERTGIPVGIIRQRLVYAWPLEKVLGQPMMPKPHRLLEYRGEAHTIAEWVRITGINQTTISARVVAGWPMERVLERRLQYFRRSAYPEPPGARQEPAQEPR